MAKREKEVEDSQVKQSEPKKKPEKKQDKNKKPNFFVRLGRKIKETFSELKRVTWPSFGKVVASTGIVIVVVLIFTVLVTGVNVGFSHLLDLLIKAGTPQ